MKDLLLYFHEYQVIRGATFISESFNSTLKP